MHCVCLSVSVWEAQGSSPRGVVVSAARSTDLRLSRPPKKGSLICQNNPFCRGMESLEDIQKCANLHFLNFSFYVKEEGGGGERTNNKLVNHVVKFKEKCFGKLFQSSARNFAFIPSVSTRLLPSTICQQQEDWKNSTDSVIISNNCGVLLLLSSSSRKSEVKPSV